MLICLQSILYTSGNKHTMELLSDASV